MKSGWSVKPLGELVEISSGGTPSKARPDFWVGDIPWVSPKDMKSAVVIDSEDHISEAAVLGSATRLIKAGSLLMVVRSGILARTIPVALAGRDLTINQDIKALTPFKELHGRFLAHLLAAKEPELLDKVTRGATVHKLDTPIIRSLQIPIPPLEEQQRIVAVLDEAFDGLSRARAHAEANLQNARELVGASVEYVFENLTASTAIRELQEVCTVRGITYGVIKLGENDPSGVPCLRTSNVRPLRIDVEGMKVIAPKLSAEYRRTVLEGGEVLVNVRGTLGGVATVPDHMAGWNISREVAMVPVDHSEIDPEYASYFISTRKAQIWLTGVIKGAAYKGINLTDLRKLRIPVPSLERQREIVEEIASLRNQCLEVEVAFAAKLQSIDDLRQSLLQKAFAGELT